MTAFRYEIVFPGIQPCFLPGRSERLACFEPTEASRFLKKLEVYSVYSIVRESSFLKGNFCIDKGSAGSFSRTAAGNRAYDKGYMDVFYIFALA